MQYQWALKTSGRESPKVHPADLGIFDHEVMGVFVIPLFPQREQKREPQKSIPWVEPQLEGQVAGEYDSEFDCGYGHDDERVFPPYRRPVGAGVLEKIARPPSFPVTVSCNEGAVMSNASYDMVENASYDRKL